MFTLTVVGSGRREVGLVESGIAAVRSTATARSVRMHSSARSGSMVKAPPPPNGPGAAITSSTRRGPSGSGLPDQIPDVMR